MFVTSARIVAPLWLALSATFVVGAAPPPPPAIAARIRDGRFDPGDYGWLRGMFAGASATEVADHRAVVDWRNRCRTSDMVGTRAELVAMGVDAGDALDAIPYRSLVCDQVATVPEPLDLGDWVGFQRDVAVVRPIAGAFLAAASAAEDAAAPDRRELRDALIARTIGEQTLRSGISWAAGETSGDGSAPSLTPRQRGILTALIATELASRDHENTAWLKGVVRERGWPKRSQVGADAAKAAWLLIQHADADPAFQLRTLRLMDPLLAAGEVDRRRHAYLYDRIALKISGKQRYATQLTCRGGRYLPRAVEDASRVDALRAAAGLDALAEYEARVLREMGPCADQPPER